MPVEKLKLHVFQKLCILLYRIVLFILSINDNWSNVFTSWYIHVISSMIYECMYLVIGC